MLIQFSAKNFKTFKERATLSLVASNYDKDTREHENIFEDSTFNLRILKSAVVFGANASGKTKLFEALLFMKHFVIRSSNGSQIGDGIDVTPFRLNNESENLPSEFEVVFTHQNVLYRYGFEVTKKNVIAEWLYYRPKTKEIELFYRDEQELNIHERNFTKGKLVIKEGLLRDNALLVSVAAQFNDSISIAVIDWFKKLKTIGGQQDIVNQDFTMEKMEDQSYKTKILDFLRAADLGIQDIQLQKPDIAYLPRDMAKLLRDKLIMQVNEENAAFLSDVLTTHKKYDTKKKPIGHVHFSMEADESSGTKKLFALTAPILDVLEKGYIFLIDDIDSMLHSNLLSKIVSLFNNKALNPKHAQLICNAHDTNLLSAGLLRRDQIWFTEKNKYGEAQLYSLSDFKSGEVRKTEPFEENYIRGKYGAVPFLESFDSLNNIGPQYENEGQKI